MNYYDARKQASQGAFEAYEWPEGWCEVIRKERITSGFNIKFRDIVARMPYYRTPETIAKGKADAALLAHCFNKFDILLNLLKCTDDGKRTRDCYTAVTGQDYDADIAECEEVE